MRSGEVKKMREKTLHYFSQFHNFITSQLLIFAICVICGVNASAAETLTLREAISAALENNPQLKAFNWTVQSQKEDSNMAKSHLYPKLSIEEKFTRTDNPTYGFMAKLNQERFTQQDFAIDSLNHPDDISDFQTSFSFEQPVFVPRIFYGINLSERELDAKKTEFERAKSEVARNVVRSALMIQTAKEYLRISQSALNDAQEHKRLASLRYDTGLGLYSDVLRADAGIKNAEVMMAKAEGNLEIAMRTLGLVTGSAGPVDIVDEKPSLVLDDLTVYLEAANQREDLKAVNLRYENTMKNVEMEKAIFLPEIGIGGSYLLNDHKSPFASEGESYVFTAFLRWNLFDASLYHKVKKAEADANEMKQRASGLGQEIQFRVNEAYIRIREKGKTLSLSKAALEDAAEALRLVRTRYENGLAPVVDLLDTQVMLDNARAKNLEAENEYVNSIVDLYYQSGMLLKGLGVGD